MLVWESIQVSLLRFSKDLRLLKSGILPILLASTAYPSLCYCFQEVGSSMEWGGISFQFPPARYRAENRLRADSGTAVFVFIVSRAGWWRVQNEAFGSCHRSSWAMGLFSLTRCVSTDIILLISLGTGWGSTQSLPPLLPFNLHNQHLLQSFAVLLCGTLSSCQC